MARSTKVIGFSLPPEINDQIEEYAARTHKTRSELLREMIEQYFSKPTKEESSFTSGSAVTINQVLKDYWQIRSTNTQKETTVVGLAVIRHPLSKKVLICQRAQPDLRVPNLNWCFPGITLDTLDFQKTLTAAMKARLSIDVVIGDLISTRTVPDASADQEIVTLYFSAQTFTTKPIVDTFKYAKTKWVEPREVFQYFTTSVSDEVTRYLLGQ